jgi:hypothetical protein
MSLAGIKSNFGHPTFELAKLNTCKIGATIGLFPSNLIPNQKPEYKTKKGEVKAKSLDRISVKVGTAFFQIDGQAYGLGLHWRNMPTLDKGTVPNFEWPTTMVGLKYESKSRQSEEWYKYDIAIPLPMIIDGQFGHFEQPNGQKMPTSVLKNVDPMCYRPVATAATSNNLTRMLNLGYQFIGTVEIPKGREYSSYGITGMKIHIFKNPKAAGMLFSTWRATNSFINIQPLAE